MNNVDHLNLGKPIGGATQPHPTTGEHGVGTGVSGGVSQPTPRFQNRVSKLTNSILPPTPTTLNLAAHSSEVAQLSTPVSAVITPRPVSPRMALTPSPTSSWVNPVDKTLLAVLTKVVPPEMLSLDRVSSCTITLKTVLTIRPRTYHRTRRCFRFGCRCRRNWRWPCWRRCWRRYRWTVRWIWNQRCLDRSE
jgi:hypothetical protein